MGHTYHGGGRRYKAGCGECQEANRGPSRKAQVAWAKARRIETGKYLNAIKMERGCIDCGYKNSPVALDFDHVRDTKHMVLARMRAYSFASIDAEIAKCEVRCANCHRIKTHEGISA